MARSQRRNRSNKSARRTQKRQRKQKRQQKGGSKKRGAKKQNKFFQLMMNAKKNNLESFEYNNKTYKRQQRGHLTFYKA
jgi:hypothetical protein